MSEQEQTEEDPSLEDVPEIGASYHDANDEEPDQARLNGIETEISELEAERSDVASNAGEDNFVVEKIDAGIQGLKDERQEIQKSAEDVTKRRSALLRAAAESPGFQFTEHWLNPDVLRALTHALYGTEDEELVIADQVLREPEDAEELDQMQKIRIQREIMNIARDRISADQRVKNRWKEFEGSNAHKAFQDITRKPGVGPSEIAETHDDTSASTVRNWTSDLSNQEELKTVHTPSQGDYHLSTVGKYYAAHYDESSDGGPDDTMGSDDEEDTEGSGAESVEEVAESTEVSEGLEQQNLGNSPERPDDQSGGSTPTDQGVSVTSSEADTTEKKAKAMFENIGKGSDTSE